MVNAVEHAARLHILQAVPVTRIEENAIFIWLIILLSVYPDFGFKFYLSGVSRNYFIIFFVENYSNRI